MLRRFAASLNLYGQAAKRTTSLLRFLAAFWRFVASQTATPLNVFWRLPLLTCIRLPS